MHLGLKYKLTKLLEETPEKYYWLGFLMADGHFSKQNRLVLSLALLDQNHVYKFQKFLGAGKVKINHQAHLSVMDTNSIGILKNQYKIESNKTENPPNLSSITGDNLFCFMVGFIDGDGCIQYQTGRKDAKLTVKCHSTWKNNLEYIFKVPCKISNAGYSYLCIADNTILREFKKKIIELKLPILDRKWDKIDLSKISQYETAKNWQEKAFKLLEEGQSLKDICNVLNIKYITLYMAIKRRNNDKRNYRERS